MRPEVSPKASRQPEGHVTRGDAFDYCLTFCRVRYVESAQGRMHLTCFERALF